MGSSSVRTLSIPEETLQDYVQLTYLSYRDIKKLLGRFQLFCSDNEDFDCQHRYPREEILKVFPELKYNPFIDRIFDVFSTLRDDCLSFEDVIDLCSVMSDNCPAHIKAVWAFRIFDFDNDGLITPNDIHQALDCLTKPISNKRVLNDEEVQHITSVVLRGINLQQNDKINQIEFQHAIEKMSEFSSTFSFRI